jgi:hypothetical protein
MDPSVVPGERKKTSRANGTSRQMVMPLDSSTSCSVLICCRCRSPSLDPVTDRTGLGRVSLAWQTLVSILNIVSSDICDEYQEKRNYVRSILKKI